MGGAVVVAGRGAATGLHAVADRVLAPVHTLSHGVGAAHGQRVGTAESGGGSSSAVRSGCVIVDADIASTGFLRLRGCVCVISGQGATEGNWRGKARNELSAGFRTSECERVLHRLADRDRDAVNDNGGKDHEVNDRSDNGAETLAGAVVGDGVVGDLNVEDGADTDGAKVTGEKGVLPRRRNGGNELLLRDSQSLPTSEIRTARRTQGRRRASMTVIPRRTRRQGVMSQ